MKRVIVKKALLIFVLTGLIGFANGFAGGQENSYTDQLRQKLVETVKYPGFAKKEAIQGDVTIIFSLTDERINVKNIIATDPELGKYIKEMISGIRFKNLTISNVDFKIKIHFILI